MSEREKTNRAVSVARDIDMSKGEFLEHEFETYSLLREMLPVARIGSSMLRGPDELEKGAWLVTRYDDGCDVLSNTDGFSSQASDYPVRPWIPQAIDPPQHTSYRRIMNKWFTPDAMSAMEPHLEEFAEELVDKMLEKDEFDFVADFADPFPAKIFCELMGFPVEDHEWIMDYKNMLMHANDGHSGGARLAREKAEELGAAVNDDSTLPPDTMIQVRGTIAMGLYGYFGKLLEARRAEPTDDLITRLIEASYEDERELTEEELLDTMFLYYMAGLDTVASCLGLTIISLAENPDKRQEFVELMEDPLKVTMAVEELVRVNSIVVLPRRCTEDQVFDGAEFKTGDQVICPTQACNRDPEQFENPDEIIFDRVPNRHMGFGHGPHRCLGIHLARREMRIALQVLHRKLPDYELHPEKKPELFGGMKGASQVWLRKK
ncbi:MAG: cytochrome P450 [Pseudomonadales bacterium]|nr:cytochrome P450 [Pseudomonadales bacterium]